MPRCRAKHKEVRVAVFNAGASDPLSWTRKRQQWADGAHQALDTLSLMVIFLCVSEVSPQHREDFRPPAGWRRLGLEGPWGA